MGSRHQFLRGLLRGAERLSEPVALLLHVARLRLEFGLANVQLPPSVVEPESHIGESALLFLEPVVLETGGSPGDPLGHARSPEKKATWKARRSLHERISPSPPLGSDFVRGTRRGTRPL